MPPSTPSSVLDVFNIQKMKMKKTTRMALHNFIRFGRSGQIWILCVNLGNQGKIGHSVHFWIFRSHPSRGLAPIGNDNIAFWLYPFPNSHLTNSCWELWEWDLHSSLMTLFLVRNKTCLSTTPYVDCTFLSGPVLQYHWFTGYWWSQKYWLRYDCRSDHLFFWFDASSWFWIYIRPLIFGAESKFQSFPTLRSNNSC